MKDYQKYISALRKCAKEHKNDKTPFAHVIVSDLCLDTANFLEELEQEPCEDAISRQEVIDLLKDNIEWMYKDCRVYFKLPEWKRRIIDTNQNIIYQINKSIKPVTPQQKMGHWIFDKILDRHYYCSECKSMGVDYWDYCPNCGAKMVEP